MSQTDFSTTILGKGSYVLFGSDWCGECVKLKHWLSSVNFQRFEVDVDENPGAADKALITKLPTLQFWTTGQKREEVIGTKAITEFVRNKQHYEGPVEPFKENEYMSEFLQTMPDF